MGHQLLVLEGDALVTLSFLTLAFPSFGMFNMGSALRAVTHTIAATRGGMAIAFCTAIPPPPSIGHRSLKPSSHRAELNGLV
jgi:hypothetical protein